jgi:hypothetical protein
MKLPPLSVATTVVLAAGLVEAAVDGDVVALNIASSAFYGLNDTGTRIWEMLRKPTSIAAICGALTAEYAVDSELCEREVLALMEQLRAEGLITVVEGERPST